MKTLNFIKHSVACFFTGALLIAFQAQGVTTSTCTLDVDVTNTNTSDNTLCGGGGGCGTCCCDIPCVGKTKKCDDCVTFVFDSTFTFQNLEDIPIPGTSITPFVIKPDCSCLTGTPVELTAAGSQTVVVKESFQTALCCGKTYQVGYIFNGNYRVDDPTGSITQTNKDVVCYCDSSYSLPAVSQTYIDVLGTANGVNLPTYAAPVVLGCCDCPENCCNACPCACPSGACSIPGSM